MLYDQVQKHLALCVYSQETTNILSRDIFSFALQDQEFLAKCLSEASINWTAIRIRQMAKKLEISRATSNHMGNQAASQPGGQISQFRHQRVNLPQHKKKAMKRKQPFLTDQSQAAKVSQTKQHTTTFQEAVEASMCQF